MKIGIIGSGSVSKELAKGLTAKGHFVMISSRNPEKLHSWISENFKTKSTISVGTFSESAMFGEILILATSWTGTFDAIKMAGIKNFENKIVIDVTNPLKFIKEGTVPEFVSSLGNSGSEQIQKKLKHSHIVKAFNTMNAKTMIKPQMKEGSATLFIASNDNLSKEKVTELAKSLGFIDIIDIGDLGKSFYLETLAMLWIIIAFKDMTFTNAFKLMKN